MDGLLTLKKETPPKGGVFDGRLPLQGAGSRFAEPLITS
jgi:hypothetical protein